MGVETMVSLYQTTYTVQPLPKVGHMDLAAAFFQREKLSAEYAQSSEFVLCCCSFSIYQAKFTPFHSTFAIELLVPLLDPYYTQYLVRNRGWSYARLAMDGLRSTVFHSSSPTLCIASGSVWFDHACPDRAGCLSYEAVRQFGASDRALNESSRFDWKRFYSSDRVCLRFNMFGYNSAKCSGN